MSLKIKYIMSFIGVLFFSFACLADNSENFAIKNDSDQTYYYIMDVSSEFPVEKIKRNTSFKPFVAKRTLITFDNELEYLANLKLDTVYKGQLITEDTIKEICNKIIANFHNQDYLFISAKLDKFAMRSGILKFDIKVMNIDKVQITGPGAADKQMQLYAKQIDMNSKPAKKSFVKKYLWQMKRVYSYISSFRFVEMENNAIELIVETQKNRF